MRLHYALPVLALVTACLTGTPATRQVLSEANPSPGARAEHLPFDAPDLARELYREKRLGNDSSQDPRELYGIASRHLDGMPLYSTRSREWVQRDPHPRARERHQSAWESLGPGNIGGRTRALVIDPKKTKVMLAAGVSGGIWKTTNGGRSWRPVGDQMVNLAVNALVMDPADPQVIYAGTGEGYFREEVRWTGLPLRGAGIFRSTDQGDSWEQLSATGDSAFHWVNDLVVSHIDGDRLYAATREGVYRSLDGGEVWDRVIATRVTGGCLDLAIRTDVDSDFLFASCGTFEQATVYRKSDAEASGEWEPVLSDPGMGRTSLAVSPSHQHIVYALAASNVPGPYEQGLHAVFRSEAGGAHGTWEARVRNTDATFLNTLILTNPVNTVIEECGFEGSNRTLTMGWYVNTIAVDPDEPDTVWAGGVDLFRSDDGGRSWFLGSYHWPLPRTRDQVHADQHGLVFHPKKSKVLFSLNDGGIYRTNNSRAALNTADDAICHAGSSRMKWRPLNTGFGVTQFYHGTPYADGTAYLGGTQDNGTVLGSDHWGENQWVRILGGDGAYSAIDPNDPLILYASTQGARIRKSTDGGYTFDLAITGIDEFDSSSGNSYQSTPDGFLFISPFVMDPSDSQRLWLGGRRLWRTDDGAQRWQRASAHLPGGAKVSARQWHRTNRSESWPAPIPETSCGATPPSPAANRPHGPRTPPQGLGIVDRLRPQRSGYGLRHLCPLRRQTRLALTERRWQLECHRRLRRHRSSRRPGALSHGGSHRLEPSLSGNGSWSPGLSGRRRQLGRRDHRVPPGRHRIPRSSNGPSTRPHLFAFTHGRGGVEGAAARLAP